jgi:16S rRNA pseudouridine516 synthase
MKSRLDKVLACAGFGSRREIKRILREREVTVNGVVSVDPATAVDPESDEIALAGKRLSIKERVYLMLNKPAGVVTSTDDPLHRTVMDLFGEPWSRMELFPIGRLDIDTEGLLVITNDGPLTHRLTSPKSGVDKTYLAALRDPVDEETFAEYARRFREGVAFRDGYTTLPAELRRASATECAEQPGASPMNVMRLTIQEGKYHQVKKMFKVVGNEVVFLKRLSMGSLVLDASLAAGEYRELAESEVEILRDDR